MRFKTFLYHFLVVAAIIVIMGAAGYFSLKQLLYDRVENKLRAKAQLLVTQLENPKNRNRKGWIINRYGVYENGLAWVINRQGEFVHFPEEEYSSSPLFKEKEQRQINPRAIDPDEPSFLVGTGLEKRMVYAEPLNSGNILVVTNDTGNYDIILTDYSNFIFYVGLGLLFASFYVLIFLSYETLKPLFSLQEYAKNLAVGEYIDRAISLKEPDVIAVAAILERFYIWTRRENFVDSNPMSGLPGNKSLYDTMFKMIEKNKPMAIAFVDANDFTAYNNKYGFEKGDSVIRFMAVVTLNAIKETGNEEDKVFHLGGDRFIFTSTPDKVRKICEKIIEDYDNQIAYYYDEKAREEGYIISTDKNGNTGKYMFMPICIGVATNKDRELSHPLQIGHIVGEIRNFLRNREGSDFLIDRRKRFREIEFTGSMAPFSTQELEEMREEFNKRVKGMGVRELKPGGVTEVDREQYVEKKQKDPEKGETGKEEAKNKTGDKKPEQDFDKEENEESVKTEDSDKKEIKESDKEGAESKNLEKAETDRKPEPADEPEAGLSTDEKDKDT